MRFALPVLLVVACALAASLPAASLRAQERGRASRAGVAPPREPAPSRGSAWHFDVDFGFVRTHARMLVPARLAGACEASAPAEVTAACSLPDVERDVGRVVVSLGLGAFAVEAAILSDAGRTAAARMRSDGYLAWQAGVRFDSSFDGWLFVHFRFAYVRQTTPSLEGDGARAALGLDLRPWGWLTLYGEAGAEILSAPGPMRAAGAPYTWATSLATGSRISF
jgi:hypothetical protein